MNSEKLYIESEIVKLALQRSLDRKEAHEELSLETMIESIIENIDLFSMTEEKIRKERLC